MNGIKGLLLEELDNEWNGGADDLEGEDGPCCEISPDLFLCALNNQVPHYAELNDWVDGSYFHSIVVGGRTYFTDTLEKVVDSEDVCARGCIVPRLWNSREGVYESEFERI